MVRFSRFSALSAYTHGESHLLQRTVPGAIVTLCGVLLAIILFFSELRAATQVKTLQEMHVETTNRKEMLMLRLNLTLLSLPCQALNLDLRDASGQRMTDTTLARGGLHKMRLDRWGKTMGMEYVYPGYQVDYSKLARDRQTVQDLENALNNHEGCMLSGTLQVKRMAGVLGVSIHIQDFMSLPENVEQLKTALERQHEENTGRSEAKVDPRNEFELDQTRVNISHVVNELDFGHIYPNKQKTLQGVKRLVDQVGGVYRYYLSIVPVRYAGLKKAWKYNGYQYSVNEYYGPHRAGDGRKPGVYFHYDIAPIAIDITETRKGIAHLLTRLCAVIGGVFAVTGMIDRWTHKLFNMVFGESSGGSSRPPRAPQEAPYTASYGNGTTGYMAPAAYAPAVDAAVGSAVYGGPVPGGSFTGPVGGALPGSLGPQSGYGSGSYGGVPYSSPAYNPYATGSHKRTS